MQQLSTVAEDVTAVSMELAAFVPVVANGLQMVKNLQPDLRPGSTTGVEKILRDKLALQHNRIFELLAAGKFVEHDNLSSLAGLVSDGEEFWPCLTFLTDMATMLERESSAKVEGSKWSVLTNAMTGAIDDDGGLNLEALEGIAKHLSVMEGLVATGDFVNIVDKWCEVFFSSSCLNFPEGGLQLYEVFAAVVALLPQHHSDGLRHRQHRFVQVLHDASEGLNAFKMLGQNTESRLLADKGYKAIKTLLQGRVVLREVQDSAALPASSAAMKSLQGIDEFIEVTKKEALEAKQDSLQQKIDLASPTAMGGKDGAAWHDGLDQTVGFPEMLKHAKRFFMKRSAKTFKDDMQNIEAELKDYQAIAEILSAMPVKELVVSAEGLLAKLQVTYTEGLLLVAFTSNDTAATDLKRQVHKIKKSLSGKIWDEVIFKPLRIRGEQAMKLKKG